jgi:CO/xanthine dehydrogenase FAD-binding subunit
LLQRTDVTAVPLAGGSWLVPRLRGDVDLPGSLAGEVDTVVDLADLGLDAVRFEGAPGSGWVHLGATTLLAELAGRPDWQALAGGVLAEAARREGPLNLRNTATIAGTLLAGESSSELLLALLVLTADAIVVDGGGERTVLLADLLADRPALLGRGLITELCLPWPASGVRGGLARVARTPADQPIVAAAALVDGSRLRVAVGGVTPLPVLLQLGAGDDLAQTIASALRGQKLLSDFRGSSEYRQAMAPILARRAVEQARS